MQVIEGAGRYTPAKDGEPNDWVEHLASKDLSVGTYCLPPGGLDNQQPHTQDEIYVVRSGTATLVTDSGTAEVGPGSVIFVPAHERHQFTNVAGDLALLVIFAPPFGSRGQAG
jgi:mannose-6-phosphate isomerase-like protein (cupin superfamily)